MSEITPDLGSVSRFPIEVDDQDMHDDIQKYLSEAREFINFYDWGRVIKSEYLGYAVEGVIYVFLFEISPGRPDVPRWIWVIVGDVPPAYVPGDEARDPYQALDGYIDAMEQWVEAARGGKSVQELIPVNVDANPANAEMLAGRLKFLDEKVLPLLHN